MPTPGDLTHAQEMYDAYISAETAVTKGQSYSIGGRSLTRADLEMIQKGREYWGKQVQLITSNGSNQPRVMRVIPV